MFSKIVIAFVDNYSTENQIELVLGQMENIINDSPKNITNYGFNPQETCNIIINGIKKSMKNHHKEKLLDLLYALYNKYENKIIQDFDVFIGDLMKSINFTDYADAIIMKTKNFLCNLTIPEQNVKSFGKNLILKFQQDKMILERTDLVVQILQNIKSVEISKLYESFADALQDIKDYEFITKIVTILNLNFLQDPDDNFRNSLINQKGDKNSNESKKREDLFLKLYTIWSFDPISLLIFCVITEHFELAYNIILNFIKVKLDEDYYYYLFQLVEQLESESYNYIRLRLLKPEHNIYLIKTLYGILMLLPQGSSFNILSNRLINIQTVLVLDNAIDDLREENHMQNINKYINIFLQNQKLKKNKNVEENVEIKK